MKREGQAVFGFNQAGLPIKKKKSKKSTAYDIQIAAFIIDISFYISIHPDKWNTWIIGKKYDIKFWPKVYLHGIYWMANHNINSCTIQILCFTSQLHVYAVCSKYSAYWYSCLHWKILQFLHHLKYTYKIKLFKSIDSKVYREIKIQCIIVIFSNI